MDAEKTTPKLNWASSIIRAAITAAEAYDGTERLYRRVLARLLAFESCAQQVFGDTICGFAEREATLAQQSVGSPVTTQDLLEKAIQSFAARVHSGTHVIKTVSTGMVFLPANAAPLLTGSSSGTESREGQEAPRLAQLIDLLGRHSPPIFADDIVIYKGTVDPNRRRRLPYNLVHIPRLKREVLICDQIGEACFVGQNLRGPLFWATSCKPELSHKDDVTRIPFNQRYETRLLSALFENNPVGPKVSLSNTPAFPITADIILIKAVEYASLHKWTLPAADTGNVSGMPGQTWSHFHTAINEQLRGFDIPDVKGLGDLYNLFGLKIGNSVNREVVQRAWHNIQQIGHHGLERQDKVLLTADFILRKAVEYASCNEWRLPGQYAGDVSGMPGQTWSAFNHAIVEQLRGFDIQGVKGLSDLYNLFGLKIGKSVNGEAVQCAWHKIRITGHHGLTRQDRILFTANFILNKAIEYARVNGWKLPGQYAGEVNGMPGQTWRAFNQIIRKPRRGFDIPGLKGLKDLYILFGLRDEKSVDTEAVQCAWLNICTTDHHGLVRAGPHRFQSTGRSQSGHDTSVLRA